MSRVKQIRPLGEITSDLETLYEEMIDDHGLQEHEILGLLHLWIMVHRPDAIERYVADESRPELFYGPASRTREE